MKKLCGPFYDSNGNPVLTKSYCAFLDVLGFKQMVQESFAGNAPYPLFARLHRIIQAEILRLNMYQLGSGETDWALKVFTDNIVLGYPLFSGDGESEYGFVIGRIAEYQLTMSLAGFFVRGGLAIGPLFMDDNIVYGPAIIEAYRAESELARDPRIVLSQEVQNMVMQHTKYYADPGESPQNRELIVDPDGHVFVNYLEMLVIEDDAGPCVAWKKIELHKEQIEKNLSKFKDKPVIWSKYYWLANYHDYFCLTHQQYSGYKKAYLIDPGIAKPEFSRLVKAV